MLMRERVRDRKFSSFSFFCCRCIELALYVHKWIDECVSFRFWKWMFPHKMNYITQTILSLCTIKFSTLSQDVLLEYITMKYKVEKSKKNLRCNDVFLSINKFSEPNLSTYYQKRMKKREKLMWKDVPYKKKSGMHGTREWKNPTQDSNQGNVI